MSGIEIAGLLLGAFPLIISALEHYRQSAEVFEDWLHIKTDYTKCRQEIKFHEMAFGFNLERFLLPLVVDDDEIAALVAEPGGMKWKDPALEDILKTRLPKSYELFLDTIYAIQSTMDDLKEELGVSREAFQEGLRPKIDQKRRGKSRNPLRKLLNKSKQETSTASAEKHREKWLSRSNIEFQAYRVKFTLRSANRAKLFEEFARYNERLGRLLDTNDESAALKQSRKYAKNSIAKKRLWKLWRHAANVHDLMGRAWCCQCKGLHRACLLLHHELHIECIEFSICFLYAPSLTTSPCPWTWKELSAQYIDNIVLGGNITLVVPQASRSEASLSKPPLKSSMRNASLSALPSRPKVNWTNMPSPTAESSLQSTRPVVITDLCSTLATCDISSSTSSVLGLLEGDEDSYILRQGAKAKPPGEVYQKVSLESLLSSEPGYSLDRRQRYKIAYTLASSHLRLYPSPWLHSQWSKEDIIFDMDPQDTGCIQIDQSYMLRAVSAKPAAPASFASSDRSLHTLGILLIELCFGTALEDHEMRRQYQSSIRQQDVAPDLAATLDLAVALEWSRSVYREAGETYADAVNWCLRGQRAGAKDDKWREELFANVVRPLQSCHEIMSPISRDE